MLKRRSFNVGALRVALAAVGELGLDSDKILRRLALDPARLQNPNERLPLIVGLRFWKICEELSRDPLIGLRAGARIPFGKYPLLDYLCASASTIGEGLALFSRYVGIVNDGLLPKILERGDEVEVHVDRRLSFIPFRTGDEFHLAILLARLRFLTDAEPGDYSVGVSHSGGGERELYEQILGLPVRFGAPRTSVVIRRPGFLSASPSREAKLRRDEIFPMVETLLGCMGGDSGKSGELVLEVHRALAELCPSGLAQMARVSKRLGMSERTLQRRLAELGTGFDAELAGYRRYTSISLLEIGTPIDDVAFLLGYQHTTNFIRAFKAWYGSAPGNWAKEGRS